MLKLAQQTVITRQHRSIGIDCPYSGEPIGVMLKISENVWGTEGIDSDVKNGAKFTAYLIGQTYRSRNAFLRDLGDYRSGNTLTHWSRSLDDYFALTSSLLGQIDAFTCAQRLRAFKIFDKLPPSVRSKLSNHEYPLPLNSIFNMYVEHGTKNLLKRIDRYIELKEKI